MTPKVKFVLPTNLQKFSDQNSLVISSGSTILHAIENFQYPALTKVLMTSGKLNDFVVLFMNGRMIEDINADLSQDVEVQILIPVAGG